MMSQFLQVLGQIELDPSRTNGGKNVDFFPVFGEFHWRNSENTKTEIIQAAIEQVCSYLGKLFGQQGDDSEEGHLKRRQAFVTKVEKRKVV